MSDAYIKALKDRHGLKAQDYKNGAELFASKCEFMRSVITEDQLPNMRLFEVAFAGRSNVGKSSLINGLLGKKDMARTSKTPGRTQQLNFFNLGDRVLLVDMPGYGYAKVPDSERRIWDEFLPHYLSDRTNLKRVFVLIDARHGIKDSDRMMLDVLNQAAVPYQPVFTKCDQVKTQQIDALQQQLDEMAPSMPVLFPHPVFASSRTGQGIDILQAYIAELIKAG